MIRRLSLLIGAVMLCAALAGCGWQPLYAERDTTAVDATLNDVGIGNIAERRGQMLRNLLIDRMYGKGRPASPHWQMEVELIEWLNDLGIRKDATAARSQLTIIANVTLINRANRKTVLKFETSSLASFNKVDAQYAALSAEENARERAVRDVADKIVNRLALHFADTR